MLVSSFQQSKTQNENDVQDDQDESANYPIIKHLNGNKKIYVMRCYFCKNAAIHSTIRCVKNLPFSDTCHAFEMAKDKIDHINEIIKKSQPTICK